MQKFHLIVIVIWLLGLTGCGPHYVTKEWAAIGGSQADATIQLAYDHFLYERPMVLEQQALDLAKKHCNSWGYTDAEAFGGATENFVQATGKMRVTKVYKCLGR